MKRFGPVLITAFCLGFAFSNANAGNTLFLKTGAVHTANLLQAQSSEIFKGTTPRYYVVQFSGPIGSRDRADLTTLGAKIIRYLPDDALIVFAGPLAARTIVKSSPTVSAVVPYSTNWKISPDLAPSSVFNANQEVRLLVALFPSETLRATTQAINALDGVKVVSSNERWLTLDASREAMSNLASIDGVEWVQLQPQVKTMDLQDPSFARAAGPTPGDYSDITGYESGTKVMNFDAAYARGFTGKGQIAAMADTGMDTGDVATLHVDLNGRVPSAYITGYFSKSWGDPMGHGTHVSGSVIGNGTKSGGRIRGGAYEAKFIPTSMWSPMLSNLSVPSKLSDLFQSPYNDGARIHTNSWGSASLGVYDSMAQQVDEFMAEHPDMLILFAAGNSGADIDKDGRIDANSIGSPATAKNVLTVGASKNYVLTGGIQKMMKDLRNGATNWGVEPIASSKLSENPQGIAAFSSRGPTADGRTKPEIVSPGTNILSTRSSDPNAELLWGAYNSDYLWSGGTSMATPLTAGAATVVRQYLVQDRKITNPSAALVKAALMHTATDLYPGQFGEVGQAKGQELLTHRPNSDEGYGLTDLNRATQLSGALIVDEHVGLATGESHAYPIKVSASGKLTATLVYTDAAGAVSASKALVNDLDLVVVDSSGKETAILDRVNNNELIEMAVSSGNYEIRVKGFSVPQGPAAARQPYALIVSVN